MNPQTPNGETGRTFAAAPWLGRKNRDLTIDDICKSVSVIRQHLPQSWLLWLVVLTLRGGATVASAGLTWLSVISKYAARWQTGRMASRLRQKREDKAP